MTMLYAHADRAGIIKISTAKEEDGLLLLAQGQGQSFIDKVQVNARLAYDGVTMLVPGVPEAENDKAALAAVRQFCNRLDEAFVDVNLVGVFVPAKPKMPGAGR